MSPTIFFLIALMKTNGEGGTVQIAYADLAACEAAGAQLQHQFEALPFRPDSDGAIEIGHPEVLYTCLAAPDLH